MFLIDSHIHLDADDFQPDSDGVISRSLEHDVKKMLVPNVDSSTSNKVLEVCKKYPGNCYPMMGLHPTSVKKDFEKELAHVEEQFALHSFIAVGEIGIDLYWDKTFFHEQEIAFVRQMELARAKGLPAVIHSRKSLEEIMSIIKENKLGDVPAVFHCFPGSVEQAKRVVEDGYYLGIGGVLTFKNSGMAEVVRQLPLENILLETDAPWLAPVPYRGKRNEPAYISLIAQKVAELKGVTVEEVAEVTTANAEKLFPALIQK